MNVKVVDAARGCVWGGGVGDLEDRRITVKVLSDVLSTRFDNRREHRSIAVLESRKRLTCD